jgi:hypothetical protein
LNVLNNTQRIIRGYISSQLVKSDTSNARLSVANSILQNVEDKISVLQDSLNTLNATQLIISGLLAVNNTKLDSLKGDTELLRALAVNLRTLLTSLDGKDFSTGAKQDSIKNDTELMRNLLVNLRTSLQTLDDAISGSEMQVDVVTMPETEITLNGEEVTINQSRNATSLDTVITISATTATQLPAITGCREITVTNLTTGATLRIGKDNSVATQGGIYWYGDSMYTDKEANVNRFYAYADIETSVRISWGY